MTDPEQEEENVQADDSQFDALMRRSGELVEQYFQLFRVISGGEKVHIVQGERYFISSDT